MAACGHISAKWLPSTMRLPPSTRPSGSRGKRLSAFIREESGLPNACEGLIHAQKESFNVEHEYADRLLSQGERRGPGNLLSRSRSPRCSHRFTLARLSVV